MISYKNPHEGETWESMRARLCTPEQIAKADKWVEKIGKKIEAREARERLALARQAQVYTNRAQAEARA